MNKARQFLVCIIIAATIISCIDEIETQVLPEEQSIILVDGYISNEEGPYQVTIRRLVGLNEPPEPLSSVKVSIEDNTGYLEELSEGDDGVYITRTIQGIVGREYRLRIEVNNTILHSKWEKITPPPKSKR